MQQNKTYISIDIECDGPTPGEYSMIEIGAVIIEDGLKRTFFAQIAPITDKFNNVALKVSGKTREETLTYAPADEVIKQFTKWVAENTKGTRPVFVDDNGFDWAFVNYYLWKFTGNNIFGHSDFNLNSMVKGIYNDPDKSVKELHDRELTHNAVEDAKDNAKVFLKLKANNWKPV
jgi:DNA polymerase III epsilon subunit-like protein